MNNEIAIREQYSPVSQAMTVNDMMGQVKLIQELMHSVMKDKEHYGTIPGCGEKKSLFKPGAEKLSFVFRLAPSYDLRKTDLPNGHREYEVTCQLVHMGSNVKVAQGVGSCSTMESKYRYRPGPVELTDKPVPRAYWDMRKSDPKKAQESIGGKGFTTKKDDNGIWMIAKAGERMEHDNPADYYNTVLKMAKKRAHVDAVLTGTAASDIFTQDIEDIKENLKANAGDVVDVEAEVQQEPKETPREEQAAGWRSMVVPFGKDKGKKFGELAPGNLKWWLETWEPKEWPEGSGKFSDKDIALQAALSDAQRELQQ